MLLKSLERAGETTQQSKVPVAQPGDLSFIRECDLYVFRVYMHTHKK